MVFQLIGRRGDVTLAELPAAFSPAVGFAHGHFLGQVHPLQTGEGAGLFEGMGFIELLAGQDATGLGAFSRRMRVSLRVSMSAMPTML